MNVVVLAVLILLSLLFAWLIIDTRHKHPLLTEFGSMMTVIGLLWAADIHDDGQQIPKRALALIAIGALVALLGQVRQASKKTGRRRNSDPKVVDMTAAHGGRK